MILISYVLALLLNGPFDTLLLRSPQGTSIIFNSTENQGPPAGFSEPCSFNIEANALDPTSPTCPGTSTGSIVLVGMLFGSPPYTYDWDNIGTQGNDVYDDDGETTLNSIPAGTYQLLVYDAAGCFNNTSVVVVDAPQIVITSEIDPITGCEATGGINIITYSGPQGIVIYDWNLASTDYNDDFGAGAGNYGLPVGEDDAQDLISNTLAGTYYLTISVSDAPLNPTYECIYLDTFVVTANNSTGICPGTLGDISYDAGNAAAGMTYQWQVDSTGTFLNLANGAHYSGVTARILNVIDAPSGWYGYKYRCRMILNAVPTFSQVFTLRFSLCWNGGLNLDWENINNWNCLSIPNANTDVYIPSGIGRYPRVNDNRACRSINIQQGASLTVRFPFKLDVLGD